MTQYLVVIGIFVVGMILGFVYHMLNKIDKNIENLFDSQKQILALYNDLDKRIVILETKAQNRRHDYSQEAVHE